MLPIISKIFHRVLLERIKKGIDKKLKKEQASFRPNGNTTDLYIKKNILEQANDWRSSLYTHFVDFEKALDSVHRESSWNTKGQLWNSAQDGESGNGHIRRV